MEDWLYSGLDAVGKWGQFYDGLSFIFFELILVALGLGHCNWAPSPCRDLELPFLCRLLIAVTSLGEHRLSGLGPHWLQCVDSVVAAWGLQTSGSVVVALGFSCFAACGIFPG